MKTNMLRKFLSTLIQVSAFALVLICFTNQTHAAEVGGVYRPAPFTGDTPVSHGYLVVYTPTQETTWGCGADYYPHTSYQIFDAGGAFVQRVSNHDSNLDEHPQTVRLSPGTYTIRGRGFAAQVQIKQAETTKVHLDN